MLINNIMRIKEIMKEFVDVPTSQSNSTQLDPHVLKQKEKEIRRKAGEDPDTEEITQDFPE